MRALPSILALVVLCACTAVPAPSVDPSVTIHAGKDVSYAVEVADTPQEHEKGLMGRDTLDAGTGMLFVFPKESKLAFWMKNTTLPLDIIFINNQNTIVTVKTMVPCEADPCPVYQSGAAAKYALEIPGGDAQQYGLRAGQQVALQLGQD
ncbi:MAG: DUF192 domain-containing protein [Nanoarchaeota archaeon]